MYMFESTNKKDKVSIITVFAKTYDKATKLVNKKFIDWKYKGKPQILAV